MFSFSWLNLERKAEEHDDGDGGGGEEGAERDDAAGERAVVVHGVSHDVGGAGGGGGEIKEGDHGFRVTTIEEGREHEAQHGGRNEFDEGSDQRGRGGTAQALKLERCADAHEYERERDVAQKSERAEERGGDGDLIEVERNADSAGDDQRVFEHLNQ